MKIKKIFIILCILLFVITMQNISYAAGSRTITDLSDTAKDWIEEGEKDSVLDPKPATDQFQEIAGLLWGIGIFVAVAVGMILGIKFLSSTPEGKAEISTLLTPYIVGVVAIVGALTIWRIVINILDV